MTLFQDGTWGAVQVDANQIIGGWKEDSRALIRIKLKTNPIAEAGKPIRLQLDLV